MVTDGQRTSLATSGQKEEVLLPTALTFEALAEVLGQQEKSHSTSCYISNELASVFLSYTVNRDINWERVD